MFSLCGWHKVCFHLGTMKRGKRTIKVGITVWDQRISPVFDASASLMFVEVLETEIVDRRVIGFQAGQFDRFLRLLADLQVEVLICGALCADPENILARQGVKVISFMAGDAGQVLQLFIEGKELDEFAMPGCRWRRCCRGRTEQGIVRIAT